VWHCGPAFHDPPILAIPVLPTPSTSSDSFFPGAEIPRSQPIVVETFKLPKGVSIPARRCCWSRTADILKTGRKKVSFEVT